MIAGMADGGRVLEEPRYVDAARRAAEFVLTTMRDGDGGLLRTYRTGSAKVAAFLEDYALVIRGLLVLHRATGESRWLEAARELVLDAQQRFREEGQATYYDTLPGQDDLFVRTRNTYDGAVPCGNSVMLNNLLDLHELTGEDAWLDEAEAMLAGLSGAVATSPVSTALTTLALARMAEAHPQRLAAAAPAASAQGGAKPVVVETSAGRVELSAGSPGRVDVTLRINGGHHINAHEPGQANLIGLSVMLVGADGLVAHADYPEGELYEGEIRVHRGEVTVPVQLERTGAVTGEPRLAVTYQVCTDRVCLAPTTETLPVTIVAK
jgi:hypothetical protein